MSFRTYTKKKKTHTKKRHCQGCGFVSRKCMIKYISSIGHLGYECLSNVFILYELYYCIKRLQRGNSIKLVWNSTKTYPLYDSLQLSLACFLPFDFSVWTHQHLQKIRTKKVTFFPSIFWRIYFHIIQKPITTIINATLMYMCVFVKLGALTCHNWVTKPPATLICCSSNFLCSMLT